MSTRGTIIYNEKEGWHLFDEHVDGEVYLEWDRPPLELAIPIPREAIKALQDQATHRLRKLLAELAEAAEEAEKNGNIIGVDEYVERLKTAIDAAKEEIGG